MSDVIRGLQAGYGLADHYLNTQRNIARQEKQDQFSELQQGQMQKQWQQQNEQYEYQVQQRPTIEQRASEEFNARMAGISAQTNAATSANNLNKFQLAQGEKQAIREDKAHRQNQAVQLFQHSLQTGTLGEMLPEVVKIGQGTQFVSLLDASKQQAVKRLSQHMDAGNSKLLISQSNAPMLNYGGQEVESNEVIQLANEVLRQDLNKSVGSISKTGRPINQVDFMGFEPSEDGQLRLKVLVTDSVGQQYPSYVTELRSADPNDPVAQITPDLLMEQLAAQEAIVDALQQSPEFMALANFNRPHEPNKAGADLQAKIDVFAQNSDLPKEQVAQQLLSNQSKNNAAPKPMSQEQAIKLAQKDLEMQKLQMSPQDYQSAVIQRANKYLSMGSGTTTNNNDQDEVIKALQALSAQAPN